MEKNRKKIVLIFIKFYIPFVILVVISTNAILNMELNKELDEIGSNFGKITDVISTNINDELNNIVEDMEYVSYVTTYADKEELKSVLDYLVKDKEQYVAVMIYDVQGKLLISRGLEFEGISLSILNEIQNLPDNNIYSVFIDEENISVYYLKVNNGNEDTSIVCMYYNSDKLLDRYFVQANNASINISNAGAIEKSILTNTQSHEVYMLEDKDNFEFYKEINIKNLNSNFRFSTERTIIVSMKKSKDSFMIYNRKSILGIKNVRIVVLFFIGVMLFLVVLHMEKNSKNLKKINIYDLITNITTDAIIIADENRKIIYLNDAFTKLTGFKKEDLIAKEPSVFSSHVHNRSFYQNMWDRVEKDGIWSGKIWDLKKDGVIYLNHLTVYEIKDKEGIKNYVGVFKDTRDEGEEIEIKKILENSQMGRNVFNDSSIDILFESIIAKKPKRLHVISLNIKNFNTILSKYGEDKTNRILNEVTFNIKNELNKNSIIVQIRYGEYLIILNEEYENEKVWQFLRRVINSNGNLEINESVNIILSAVCGISKYPDNGRSAVELIAKAHIAKLSIANNPFKSCEMFSDELNTFVCDEIRLEENLIEGIKNNEFELYYHPQVDMNKDKVVGAEVLIRWGNKDYEDLSPGRYIPIAEKNGSIIPLSNWIIKKVCEQIKEWKYSGIIDFRLSINISPYHFYAEDFTHIIKSTIDEIQIDPRDLEIEVTEGLLIQDFKMVNKKLAEIRKLGIKISLDDFGTGYSSLSYLNELQVDRIKIDKIFVDGILTAKKGAIASAIAMLAKSYNLDVIAEGVENEEQLKFLSQIGCNVIQGYYYSKPLNKNDFEKFMKRKHKK